MTKPSSQSKKKNTSKTKAGSQSVATTQAAATSNKDHLNRRIKSNPATGRSLQIKTGIHKKLSPNQAKFNKLIKQIERLQSSLQQQTHMLDQMQDYYRQTVVPYLPQEKAINIRYMKTLFSFYKRKRKELTKEEHNLLGELVLETYESIVDLEIETDPELMAIHKKLYRQNYADSLAEDFELLKEETLGYLRMNGVEVEDDIFDDVKDMDQMQEKVVEVMDKFTKTQADNPSDSKRPNSSGRATGHCDNTGFATKSSKKAVDKFKKEQEKAALKQKSLSGIYKQLAKTFHPDLEPDANKKVEKEALMQQLTQAYREKNLHMLLQLELEWLQKEENNIHQLADNQLALYIEILKEQEQELKMQADSLRWHPKYAPVMEFSDGMYSPSLVNMKACFREIQRTVKHTADTIEKLDKKDIHSISILKKIIQEFAIERAFWDDDAEFSLDDFDVEDLF